MNTQRMCFFILLGILRKLCEEVIGVPWYITKSLPRKTHKDSTDRLLTLRLFKTKTKTKITMTNKSIQVVLRLLDKFLDRKFN